MSAFPQISRQTTFCYHLFCWRCPESTVTYTLHLGCGLKLLFFLKHLLWGNYRFTGSCKGSVSSSLFPPIITSYIITVQLSKPGHSALIQMCVAGSMPFYTCTHVHENTTAIKKQNYSITKGFLLVTVGPPTIPTIPNNPRFHHYNFMASRMLYRLFFPKEENPRAGKNSRTLAEKTVKRRCCLG